jgi:hypothetical protein
VKRSRRWRVAAIVIACAVVLFCPYKSTTAPAWHVQVVDESRKPISGIRVQQGWQHFDVDVSPWLEERVTDSHGRAAFPRRVIWASLARRLVAAVDIPGGTRAGPSLFIQACDVEHLEEAKLFWDGNWYWNPPVHEGESQLVTKPVKECSEIASTGGETKLAIRALSDIHPAAESARPR